MILLGEKNFLLGGKSFLLIEKNFLLEEKNFLLEGKPALYKDKTKGYHGALTLQGGVFNETAAQSGGKSGAYEQSYVFRRLARGRIPNAGKIDRENRERVKMILSKLLI